MASSSVVVVEPGCKRGCPGGVGEEDLPVGSIGLQTRLKRSTLPSCQGQCGLMNFCRIPCAAQTSRSENLQAQALSVMSRSTRGMP